MKEGDKLGVAVVQDGARLHYAVPLALQSHEMLSRMFVDWYSAPGTATRLISRLICLIRPDLGQRMLDRYNPHIESSKVRVHHLLALQRTYSRKRFANAAQYHEWESRQMANWIEKAGFGDARALYGFVRNIHPDLLLNAKTQGLVTIVDQMIAPSKIEQSEALIQNEQFPMFNAGVPCSADSVVHELELKSWNASDHITCASDYVRDGLVRVGVSSSKISVIPYPIDTTHFPFVDRRGRQAPLTVGFIGAVNLRKGLPYFLEVAKQFDPAKVKFVMVGPIQVDRRALANMQGSVELKGAVPRSEVYSWLSSFDVYFFPSTCEGSAGSIMEAMATGLPVVTTPNSGSIVQNNDQGFINAYSDIDAHVKAIHSLMDEDFRCLMGLKARQAAEKNNVISFGRELADVVHSVTVRAQERDKDKIFTKRD